MRERPILFSGPMVRAILEGRKTQTRRVVRRDCQQYVGLRLDAAGVLRQGGLQEQAWTQGGRSVRCPYGVPGDRLWVRETWRESAGRSGQIHYAASVSEYERNEKGPWRPSIFMPRWASRLLLEVKAVRVERLQEISEEDAEAEGIEKNWCGPLDKGPNGFGGEGWMAECGWIDYLEDEEGFPAITPVDSYRSLWDSINAQRGHLWESNPWVWVIEFAAEPKEGR